MEPLAEPSAESPPDVPVGSPVEAPPGPDSEPQAAGAATPARGRARIAVIAGVAALGIGAVAVGGLSLESELTRKPTSKEVAAAGVAETASRWRTRAAGAIFPATVDYAFTGAPAGPRPRARRIGIAPPSNCAGALDRQAAEIVAAPHCRTMLRATYVDDSGTLVSTIGIAVMSSTKAVAEAEKRFDPVGGGSDDMRHGLLPVGFPGTAAERFGPGQRQRLWLGQNTSPYLFFAASGWADGRKKLGGGDQMESFAFARAVLLQVMNDLLPAQRPCEEKSVRC